MGTIAHVLDISPIREGRSINDSAVKAVLGVLLVYCYLRLET
jgi:hypothetical protein